jgi:hypothetical protein
VISCQLLGGLLRYNTLMSTDSNPVSKADRESLETRLLERIEKTETTLLREFRKWAVSFESRFRANEILVGGFSERMISLEERVSSLERHE